MGCGDITSAATRRGACPRAGAIPLDGVEVEAISAGPNKTTQSAFRVTHPTFGARVLTLCAHGAAERDTWIHALEVRGGRGPCLGRSMAAQKHLPRRSACLSAPPLMTPQVSRDV